VENLLYKKVSYDDAVHNRIFSDYISKRIVAIIPAHNEQYAIGNVLKSLVNQDGLNGLKLSIFIALDNCTDKTEEVIKEYKDK